MYVYCVYTLKSKSLKQMSNCLRRAETNVVLISFMGVLYQVRTHTVTVCNITLHMIQVPVKIYIGQWPGPMRGGFSRYIGPRPRGQRRDLWISEGRLSFSYRRFILIFFSWYFNFFLVYLPFVLILPSYFTYKCYPSGVTRRIPEGFLKISIRIIKTT